MTPEELKHTKVTSITDDNGTSVISTDSYYEDLAHSMIEYEQRVLVDRQTILREVMTCLELITKDGSPEIVLRIKGKHGDPNLLIKRWVVSKQRFGRR